MRVMFLFGKTRPRHLATRLLDGEFCYRSQKKGIGTEDLNLSVCNRNLAGNYGITSRKKKIIRFEHYQTLCLQRKRVRNQIWGQ